MLQIWLEEGGVNKGESRKKEGIKIIKSITYQQLKIQNGSRLNRWDEVGLSCL